MNIIYLGCNGFPYGFAEVQKQKMISLALVNAGAYVTIVNNKGVHEKRNSKLSYKGKFEGINYVYSSFTAYRPASYIKRNALKIIGKISEIFIIFFLRNKSSKNVAIISTRDSFSLIYYYVILRLCRYKIILSYEEFVRNINLEKGKKGIQLKFDDLASKYCNGILPISAFLEKYQQKINPKIPVYKIPALTDFDLIDRVVVHNVKEKKILFCGSSAYYENIKFIIDAFNEVDVAGVELVLIIHGNNAQNGQVYDYINRKSSGSKTIRVFSNLSYTELIESYKKASLLLIPLKPYVRDRARFPHKIAEYTASKTPILTTNVGEIESYFNDKVNCFICEKYDVYDYAKKIEFILNNKELSESVAKNAYLLGRNNFHYKSVSQALFEFAKKL